MAVPESFTEIDGGAYLTTNQAAAALANVSVYTATMALVLQNKRKRGIISPEAERIARDALRHVAEECTAAAFVADELGDLTREGAFNAGDVPRYHVFNVRTAAELANALKSYAIAGGKPIIDEGGQHG